MLYVCFNDYFDWYGLDKVFVVILSLNNKYD